jgi:histidine triad (HIT) family protein
MSECLFCNIAAGKIPCEVVYQDETVFAFKDIHPKAPIHVLVIPKRHIASLADLKTSELPLAAHMLETVNTIAKQLGTGTGYKLVINTGSEGGQAVMHLHMHLLGGKHFSD